VSSLQGVEEYERFLKYTDTLAKIYDDRAWLSASYATPSPEMCWRTKACGAAEQQAGTYVHPIKSLFFSDYKMF